MSTDLAAKVPIPTSLELLTNLPLGRDSNASPLPAPRGVPVRDLLDAAVLPALARPPCVVSFSGGRDSSAVLAVAADAARRHGLPDPVAVMMRFPDVPLSHETHWQELVLDHIGISERVVLELHDELSGLGSIATSVLRRHGVLWPGNGYVHMPVFEVARGGSVLTGVGGDELFGTKASRIVWLTRRKARPRLRDIGSVGLALLPRPLRALRWRRNAQPLPWLTRAGNRAVVRALAKDEVAWPHRWDASVHHWHASRAHNAVRYVLPALGADLDVPVVNPLVDRAVMAELARMGGPTGFIDRTTAMTALFSDLLPTAILSRPTKAGFTNAMAGAATRAFASAWDGEGVDHELVDANALRREWLSSAPSFMTVLLLQTAWLRADQATASIASSS
jgi:asparagine synthase (glutamine-hydrolysing)